MLGWVLESVQTKYNLERKTSMVQFCKRIALAALINFIHYKKNGWDIHIQEVVTEDDSVQSSNNE